MRFGLRQLIGKVAGRIRIASDNPVVRRGAGFFFGSVAVAWVGGLITIYNHEQDVAVATRNSAIAAVSDLSQLTSERRERAALVRSSIRRAAPKEEIESRKLAYDEAYVQWNSKIPGELLRIRASLGLEYRPNLQDYIDGLTNAARLEHQRSDQRDRQTVAAKPGILNIMDACLTSAYDAYRIAEFKSNEAAFAITQACQFIPLYNDLVVCMSDVSSVLYDAVTGKLNDAEQAEADTKIRASCTPSDAALKWSSDPPKPRAQPAEPRTSSALPVNTNPGR